jgi:hypothetical protein
LYLHFTYNSQDVLDIPPRNVDDARRVSFNGMATPTFDWEDWNVDETTPECSAGIFLIIVYYVLSFEIPKLASLTNSIIFVLVTIDIIQPEHNEQANEQEEDQFQQNYEEEHKEEAEDSYDKDIKNTMEEEEHKQQEAEAKNEKTKNRKKKRR